MTRKNAGYAFRSWPRLCFMIVCLTLCCAHEAAAQGCDFQAASGQPYKVVFNFHPQTATAAASGLKVVAFGDSVVWGDGDKPQHKIVTLVGQALANETGRPVEVHSFAHSGARLQTYDPGTAPGFPVSGAAPLGNLDGERPTTAEQAACAATIDADADYVLLDGCINEVGATNIALPPWLFNNTTPAKIRSDVFTYCAAPMRTALEAVASAFPHARILLMNYYRVVSKSSQPKPLWTAAQNQHEEKELERATKLGGKLQGKQDGAAAPPERPQVDLVKSAQAWRDNSTEFLGDVTSCFQWAVASANASGADPIQPVPAPGNGTFVPVCPAYTPPPGAPPSSSRISLVIFPDNDDYAYGAPHSILWLAPIPLFFGLAIHPDELFFKRNWECNFHPFRGDLACKVNPLAHPNVKGASCFSQSILAVIDGKPSPLACPDLTP